jgi:hypothetical protein
MLTQTQITEVEIVYIARHTGTINGELFAFIVKRFYETNFEPFVYLQWLMERWVVLRKHDRHLPTRIAHAYYHLLYRFTQQMLALFN